MQDSDTELLTSFVDGELSGRQRKAVLRLLHKSSEARGLLWQLRENAVAVQQLPAKRLPADFAARIMQSIEHAAAPSPSSTTPAASPAGSPVRSGRRFLARFAMAAALLLAVGGAVLYFVSQGPNDNDILPLIAFNNETPDKILNHGNSAKEPPPKSPGTKEPVKRPPGYFALRELKDKSQHKVFAKELAKQGGDRLELTVSNSAKAMHKIRAVFENHGIHVVTDGSAQGKNTKATDYWIFAENASPEELATLLSRVGGDDTFEGVQVAALSGEDCKNLANVMGIDADQVRNPREGVKLLDPIIELPGGKDKKSGLPAPQAHPRKGLALIVAANTAGAPPSQQIKSFLNQRRKLQPGTVQALLIVRQI